MEKYRQAIVDTLADLVHINTVEAAPTAPNAPFGDGARQALDYTLALLAQWGWRTCDLDGYCGWAEVGQGPLFGVLCHLDTVPLGEGWRYPPLSATIADGKMYGRGTQDDKGPFVASLYALKSLLDEGKPLHMRVRFIFGCNEETGWRCMDRYLATEERPVMSISPDGDFPVINCEKGLYHAQVEVPAPAWMLQCDAGSRVNMVPDKAVCVTAHLPKSALSKDILCQKEGDVYRLSATGRSAHGSTPQLGDNALIKLWQALAGVDDRFDALVRALTPCDGSGAGIGFADEPSGSLSLNVGYAHKQADRLVIGLDIRYPISYTRQQVEDGLRQALPLADITVMHAQPTLYVAADNPLVVRLLDAYQQVMHSRPDPLCIGGATYARALPNAVAFGPVFPGDEEMCHQVDEYVRLDRLLQMAEIYRVAFEKICF